MSLQSVFVAITIAFALILSAFLINRVRPHIEVLQPIADFVQASGNVPNAMLESNTPLSTNMR